MSELTGRLRLSVLATPGGGQLGLVHCPGRRGRSAGGEQWSRSLCDDLHEIHRWRAVAVVTLVESHELPRLGVPDLPERVRASGLEWYHLPIPDMCPPGPAFYDRWSEHGPAILGTLAGGGRVVLHCAAGLGRTGMIAAKLLTGFALEPEVAIARVRECRPGAIETERQAEYVRAGPPLSPPA